MQDCIRYAKEGREGFPIDITKVKVFPLCAACQFGAARKKAKGDNEIGPANPIPGDFVSVDTNIAGTPGFIPTKVGRPINERYHSSTLWVDKASKYL